MFNQPSTFVDEVDARLFEREEIREPNAMKREASRGTRDEEWGWEEPAIQIGSSTVFKKEPSKQKTNPGSFLGEY